MKATDRRLAELAERQHGVVSREQARAVGLSSSALWRRVSQGDLVVCGRSTLRMPGTELSWYGELTAGLLDLRPGAMIGGRAAAQLRRLDGFTADAVEFAVPRSRRNRSTNGVVRSSPDIERLDWEMVDGFPCASGTWLIIELLRDGTDDEASNAIDSACRQRLTAIHVVRRRLDRMGRQGRAGVARFERLAAAGNVESWLERRFVDLIRRAGLPEPQLQQRYELADVGVARVDFEFEARLIVVEVGGRRGYLSLDERLGQDPTKQV